MVVKCLADTTDKMHRYVKIVVFVFVLKPLLIQAPPPLRLTIDCGTNNGRNTLGNTLLDPGSLFSSNKFDVDSFCKLIHNAIPKAVKDGKFILVEPDMDQSAFGDTQNPISILPPEGFELPAITLPKLRIPRLRVPRINVPRLRVPQGGALGPPRLGGVMSLPRLADEDSSAEKMEKFKKGVKKMLHVVKVLGKVDEYLSDRTRIVIDKLSKTLGE